MLLSQFPDKEAFLKHAEKSNVIPVCVEILADTDTPVSLLKKFYNPEEPLFLFESVEGGERWGRYSFLGTRARSHVTVLEEEVEIRENGGTEWVEHGGDPLKILKGIMEKYTPAVVPELPRFWGGLVGYMSYEMVSFFERIPNELPPEKPIAHFIIPDELVIFDNVNNTLVAVALAFTDDHESASAAYDEARERLASMQERIALCLTGEAAKKRETPLVPEPLSDPELYRERVRTVKEHIMAGDIIQAVISQPFVCDAPEDIIELYRAQRYVNPSPYLYFMQLDGMTLVGSSPETMVRLENGVASLRPIAGTRHRGRTDKEDRQLADDLLSDEKERAEHLMLVDLGRNDLGRVAATGTVQVTDLMTVERYSHVMHLVSNIHCDVEEGMDAFDLLRATFPAGTLSGAPKVRAMEIIADLEEEPRGPYGGAVGYFSFNGNMDLAITIRTACVEEGKLTVRAGAGIVADSDPEKERVECENKAKAIQRALSFL